MRLKDYSFLLLTFLMFAFAKAQFQISGKVTDALTGLPISDVDIYDKDAGVIATTGVNGIYSFKTNKKNLTLILFTWQYQELEKTLTITADALYDFKLEELSL
jgi:Fe(3+) dicitrate transport protein